MITVGEIPSWVGFRVEDPDGVPLGRVVGATRASPRAGLPAEVELQVRLADGSCATVPLCGARRRAGTVRVATAPTIAVTRVPVTEHA